MTRVAILLWRARWWSPLDLVTALATFSLYSHAGWILGDQVVEVTRRGGVVSALADYPEHYDVGHLALEGSELDRLELVVRHRRDRPSSPYDWSGALGIGLRMSSPFRWLRSNPLDTRGLETCPEAVATDLRSAGLDIPDHASATSPGDLARLRYVRVRHTGPWSC